MQLWIVAWTATQCCFAHFISWYYVCDYHTRIDWCIWSVLVCFISFTAKSIILTTPSSSLKDFYFTGSWPSSRYTKQIAPCFARTDPRWRTSRQLVPCEVSALSCFHLACVCLPRHWPLWYVCLGWESWESYVTEDLSCYKSRHCSRTTSQLPNVTQTAWGCCIVKFQNSKIANRNKPWLVQIKRRLLHLF